jgi:hypothetical protein
VTIAPSGIPLNTSPQTGRTTGGPVAPASNSPPVRLVYRAASAGAVADEVFHTVVALALTPAATLPVICEIARAKSPTV